MAEAGNKDHKQASSSTQDLYQWRELRDLLNGPERRRLEEISSRLDDPVYQAKKISEILPDAITLGSAKSDRIATALQPSIDIALKTSVRKNPKSIADAIFPILGPAIRKSILATLMGMIQSLNHALNHSVSLRGLKWRLEAFRTHRSYAEIVLLKTLIYHVEQIFLIHRQTGLVLVQATSELVELRDPDLISGMLTAIQDFVNDSFKQAKGEAIDTLRLDGGHSVWIEQGSEAMLCIVIRGTPPMELRDRFQTLIEEIHQLFDRQWAQFDGDVSAFAMLKPKLEQELVFKEVAPQKKVSPLLWIGAAALVAVIGFGIWFKYVQYRQWHQLLSALRAEPGIVLLHSGRDGGRYLIEGFKDPLARDPQELIDRSHIDAEEIESRWLPFWAMDDKLVLRRAEEVLKPPQGVDLSVEQGVLKVSGRASHRWIRNIEQSATTIAGVDRYQRDRLTDIDMDSLRALKRDLEAWAIYFNSGLAEPNSGQESIVDAIATLVRQLQELQERMGVVARIAIIGHADPIGGQDFNYKLSMQRASSVHRILVMREIDPFLLYPMVSPAGAEAVKGNREDLELFRKVTFKMLVTQDQVKIDD